MSFVSNQKRRAVFLDRDGVINRMHYDAEFGTVDSPANPEQFQLLAGASRAIASLHAMGFLVIVVSNQPGIAKGKMTPALLEAIEQKMTTGLAGEGARVDAIYNCLHHPDASLAAYRTICECRKPKSGLLVKASAEWAVDLARSYTVGDGVTDIAAGKGAGTATLFVSSRKCYNCDSLRERNTWPDYIVNDLGEAARVIGLIEAGENEALLEFKLNCAKS